MARLQNATPLERYLVDHPNAKADGQRRRNQCRLTPKQVALCRVPDANIYKLAREFGGIVSHVALWKARHRITYRYLP